MASTFTNLLYHIVYSTKYRQPTIAADWQEDFYSYIGGIIKERDGISLEIIDPRTRSPLDTETILASVDKTNLALIVDEGTPRCSIAADIAATIGEYRFASLAKGAWWFDGLLGWKASRAAVPETSAAR